MTAAIGVFGRVGVVLGLAVAGWSCAGPPATAVRVGAGVEVLGRFAVEHEGRVGVFGGEEWPVVETEAEAVQPRRAERLHDFRARRPGVEREVLARLFPGSDLAGLTADERARLDGAVEAEMLEARARLAARYLGAGREPDWAVDVSVFEVAEDGAAGAVLGGRTGLGGVVVAADEWRAVLEREEADERLLGLHHPSVSVFDGQEGQVLIVNQRAFVSGFDLRASAVEFIADPRVDVFSSGVSVRMTPERMEDGRAQLALEVDSRESLGIEEVAASFGTTAPVEFQVPIARADTWTADAEIGDGQVAVLGPLRTSRGAMIVAVRVRSFAR